MANSILNSRKSCTILCAELLIFISLAGICLADHTQNILLTGYWPPTNEMLRKFSTNLSQNPGGWQGENWEGRGYNVYAYFPEFPGGTGSNPKGNGDFEIDYQDVGSWQPPAEPTGDFWRITALIHPVAIMSYGKGAGPWEIEINARNLPSSSWSNDYLSPTKPTPAPPDTTSASGYVRHSSLPVEAIAEAVNSAGVGIDAWVDWDDNPGAFLCEYMAYHDAWYQSLHSAPSDPYYCMAAGFTHVGASVSITNATSGVDAALRALIDQLDAQLIQYTISGTITLGGTPLAGVTLCGLPGNPLTDTSGFYSAQVGGGWSGAVTPLKSGYAFNASQQTYTNIRANQSAQNYTASAATADTIVFDAASSAGSSTAGTTLSWSHTISSGSNRVLVVGVVAEDSTAADERISSVKFNGVTMTTVPGSAKSRGNASSTLRTELYYMLNPPVGTYTILVTYNGSVSYRNGGAISLQNVKQQAPEAVAANSATAAAISTSITVPNSGAWIVDVVGHSNSGSFTTSTSTERWDRNSSYHTGAGATKAVTSPGSNTLSWTYSGSSGTIVHALAAFAPSETASPTPPGKATNPNPANSTTNVSLATDISWTAGSGATSHDVYFGTTSPGTFQGNQAETTFDTGTMSYNTTYYWRIDEKNAGGTTTGTVWSFTTKAQVPNVVGSTQAAAATAITGAGLIVGTVTQAYDNTVAAGLVISQAPAGGTTADTGSAVNLVISLGRPVVPNVVGMTQAVAAAAITAVDNLTVGTVTQVYSNTVVAGLVISQNPVGGTQVNTGSSVNLVISLGKPVVPNVVGMTQAAAAVAITAVDNLTIGTITQAYVNTVAAGLVISQNPVGGTQVNTGSSVNLIISLGKPVVPNVVGMTQAAATATITAIDNLKVGTVTQAYSNTVAAGLVMSQNPVGGTEVTTGSSVNLIISLGLPIIPDVTNTAQAAAEAAITAATFTVGTITTAYSDTVVAGNVISQSIVGPAVSGTAVDLVVSNGPRDRIISGRVLEPDAVTPIAGVLVAADNGGGSDVTDPNGYYQLTVAYGWSGIVDPNATGYTFDPNESDRTYTDVTSDMVLDLTGYLDAFIISGYVLKADGVTPIEGITVTPENGGGYFTNKYNGGGSDTTDPNGRYEVVVDYNWSGKVTPTHNAYTFAPLSNSYSNVVSDIADQDYAGTMLTFSISGYIKNILGIPAEGVSVTAQNGGGTDTTDASGYYEVGVSYGWTGSITAAKTDYTFTPSEAPYVNVTANLTGDFLAKLDADINGDGYVDVSDLLIMAANWLMPGDLNTGNLNEDAIVDMQDVAELSEYWMEGT